MSDDKRFAGAVSVGSAGGKSIVLATSGQEVVLVVPGAELVLSESEAWCLARQLDLACRRARQEQIDAAGARHVEAGR